MLTTEMRGDTALIARFDSMPSAVAAAVSKKLDTLAGLLEAKVKNNYLSGQSLKVRSDKLRSGIHWENHDTGTTQIRTVKPSSNTMKYAGWEYGFAQKIIFGKGKNQILSDGKGFIVSTLKKPVIIPPQPARPYLRPALADMKPIILDGLQQAAVGAMK